MKNCIKYLHDFKYRKQINKLLFDYKAENNHISQHNIRNVIILDEEISILVKYSKYLYSRANDVVTVTISKPLIHILILQYV